MAAYNYLLSAWLVAVVCAAVSAQGSVEWEALKAVSHSNLDFSNSLYKVMSRKEGNLFFSPTSIHTILALTSLGARGTTAQEMTSGLHLPADQQTTKDGFRHLMTSLQNNATVTTKIANRIFTDSRFPPTPEFVQISSADFYSASELVDFQHKHEEARGKINAWVEQNTEGKIVNLLPGGSLTPSTAMVLVNAIYFKGAWDSTFYERSTSQKPFHISETVTKNVSMMYQYVTGDFAYHDSEALNADVLEIPYAGKQVSMIVILPKEKNGLREVETKLSGMQLSSILSPQVTYPNIKLSMPKFKLEQSFNLKDVLTQMGMGLMFSDDADFSGLAQGPLKVSKVIHKAFIKVDEKGTEAAAATAILVRGMSPAPPRPEITFSADRPFIFMLVTAERSAYAPEKQRAVLFMGRYAQPD